MNVTRQILKDLYDQSPIPIYERYIVNWRGFYNRKPSYVGKRSWPHIIISSQLLLYQKAAVVLHELGHHHCAEISCICRSNKNRVTNEVHAMKFGLRKCLKYGFIRSYYWSIGHILYILNHPEDYDYHGQYYLTAAKRMEKCKEWK